jgi:tripartite-type tricarboxylate transporter receptor subunit TctC
MTAGKGEGLRTMRVAAACALAAWAAGGSAAGYPERPVRMIVPFAAGANIDLTARQLAQKFAELLGQSVVVENRGGAGGTIGTALAAKASADGYTVLMGNAPTMGIAPSVYRDLAYDPVRHFAPVGRVTSLSMVLATSAALPVASVKELVALAKARGGALNYASSGNGTLGHLSGVLLNNTAGIALRHVPYNSVPQAFVDITSGAVAAIFYPYQGLLPVAQTGKVRMLATTGTRRTSYLPDVPTLAESGMPDVVVVAWEGFFVPAGTPQPVVERLYAVLAKAAADPAFVAKLAAVGIDVELAPPQAFGAFVKSEVERFRQIVTLAGVKVD